MQSTLVRSSNPRGDAFPLVAAVGLVFLGLHTAVGNGWMAPGLAFNAYGFSSALMQAWPYLVLALGLFSGLPWARDLAAPAACLALARTLAALPRYLFLVGASWRTGGPQRARAAWVILRHSIGNEAAFAALCGITLYVLAQPELIRRGKQETKPKSLLSTEGLGFAACLLLSYQVFAASSALVEAVHSMASFPALGSFGPAGAAFSQEERAALQALGMAVLAGFALGGLYSRRIWGWLALLAQSLVLLAQNAQMGLDVAIKAWDATQAKLPLGAPAFALEAFCRNLPELATLGFVFWALLRTRRRFR